MTNPTTTGPVPTHATPARQLVASFGDPGRIVEVTELLDTFASIEQHQGRRVGVPRAATQTPAAESS